jgi:hypothetical protein
MKKLIVYIMFLLNVNMAFAQQNNLLKKNQDQRKNVYETSYKKDNQLIIETGYAISVGNYGMKNLKLNVIYDWQTSIPSFSLGFGVGIRDYLSNFDKLPDRYIMSSDVQVPVFLDFRKTLLKKRLSPYLSLRVGGSFGARYLYKIHWEGLFLNPLAGIRFKISDKFAVIAGISYESQKMEYSTSYPDYENYEKYSSSLGINIGISF